MAQVKEFPVRTSPQKFTTAAHPRGTSQDDMTQDTGILLPGMRYARRQKRLTFEDLAEAIGKSPGYLSRIERGQRNANTQLLKKIADALGCDAADLLQAPPEHGHRLETVSLPVKAEVQAGAWRPAEAGELDPDDWEIVEVPVPPGFGRDNLDACRVRGNSMNEIYPDGTILVCCRRIEYPFPIGSGDHVIVRRHDTGQVELTCKELRQQADNRIWLYPRSNDPEHQTPILLAGPGRDTPDSAGADDTDISGVVVAYLSFRAPSRYPLRGFDADD